MSRRDPLAWLDERARERRSAGLRRELIPRESSSALIDLASNDYLGLCRHPEVVAGAVEAVRRWGGGATGSRLVTGTTVDHEKLERELAEFTGVQAGLVFASGYAANLAAVTALSGADAMVVSDAGCHASLIDACRLSRARVHVVGHADVAAVAAALNSRSEQRALVLTESVFSTDGDLAPLRALHTVAREHEAVLVVDEAHGIGVRGPGGRGLVAELGLAGEPDIVVTASLSKSFGSQGGVLLADERVRDHLVDSARSFIFDTALLPAAVGAARAALTVLRREPHRTTAVLGRAGDLAEMVGAAEPEAAVVPVVLGDARRAVTAQRRCRERGVAVGCFRPPSVPPGSSRLRLTARADLTPSDLEVIGIALDDVLSGVAA